MNIIIIGATSGIGKALFEKYATDGNHIGIVGNHQGLVPVPIVNATPRPPVKQELSHRSSMKIKTVMNHNQKDGLLKKSEEPTP